MWSGACASCGGFFDLPKLQEKLTALEARMTAPDFWNNRERAQSDVDEGSRLRSLINPFRELEREIEDFDALHQLASEEKNDAHRAQAEREVATEHDRLIHKLEEFELRQFLSGESDRSNAFITIHSGAGGTESCDWADMLLRMYQRWIERSGLKSQIVDVQTGEEVGIKSVTTKTAPRSIGNTARKARSRGATKFVPTFFSRIKWSKITAPAPRPATSRKSWTARSTTSSRQNCAAKKRRRATRVIMICNA